MRRVFVIGFAGIALSGCSSFSGLDFLTPAPAMVVLQLESSPQGAEAQTSAGPACRTPCSVSVPAAPLSVTFTLDKFQPQTVSIQTSEQTVYGNGIDASPRTVMELDPNPVFAQLAPAGPVRRSGKRPPPKVASKPPASQAAPSSSSPF